MSIFHDILVLVSNNKVDETLEVFNSIYEHLQFTVEIEKDYQLNYLDVKLIRKNEKIIFDSYKKYTSSDRYLKL